MPTGGQKRLLGQSLLLPYLGCSSCNDPETHTILRFPSASCALACVCFIRSPTRLAACARSSPFASSVTSAVPAPGVVPSASTVRNVRSAYVFASAAYENSRVLLPKSYARAWDQRGERRGCVAMARPAGWSGAPGATTASLRGHGTSVTRLARESQGCPPRRRLLAREKRPGSIDGMSSSRRSSRRGSRSSRGSRLPFRRCTGRSAGLEISSNA